MNVQSEQMFVFQLRMLDEVYRNASIEIINKVNQTNKLISVGLPWNCGKTFEELRNNIYSILKPLSKNRRDRSCHLIRDYYTQYLAWAIPSDKVCSAIANFVGADPMIEIGCGSGLWALLLHLHGCNVMPQDNQKRKWDIRFIITSMQYSNRLMDTNVYNVLFLCWPEYGANYATEVLQSFTGNKLVYIGESRGGCCANDSFFKELKENWNEVPCDVEVDNWFGIYDSLYLYERKVPKANRFTNVKRVVDFINTNDEIRDQIYSKYLNYMSRINSTLDRSFVIHHSDVLKKICPHTIAESFSANLVVFEGPYSNYMGIPKMMLEYEQKKNEYDDKEFERMTKHVEKLSLQEESWTTISRKQRSKK